MGSLLGNALGILREFVLDIERVGVEAVVDEWPDLVVTYNKAKTVIHDAEKIGQ